MRNKHVDEIVYQNNITKLKHTIRLPIFKKNPMGYILMFQIDNQ